MKHYESVFKISGFQVFYTDLILQGYARYKPVITIEDGNWTFFLSKETLTKVAGEGFRQALNENFFKGFEKRARQAASKALELKEHGLSKKNNAEFSSFLDLFFAQAKPFIEVYGETEFFFFPKIEKTLIDYSANKFPVEDVLAKKINLSDWPEKERKLAEYMISMQHLKFDLRKTLNEILVGNACLIAQIIGEIKRRTKRKDCAFMTLKEIKQLLNGEKVQVVSSRKRHAFITRNEQNELVVFNEKESIGKIAELARELPVNEVRGMPAFAGIAKGKAKIIPLSLNPELHLPKIIDGDIIVADTTGPEIMLAIKKAKAIVTDEGGLMSHAAVIAREFQIPCIVGTKNGTKVFKDNDLIEVDAFKGIARKTGDFLKINDRIYGLQEITDSAAIELIDSKVLQRLKGISQEGTYSLTHGYDITRLEHSIGVYLLLKKFNASRKEQLAGLIHDVNHPVFSHVCDFVFGSQAEEDFQDRHFKEFINETELPGILEKHGFNVMELLDLHSFKLLERKIPELCADRIDYLLRSLLVQKLASHEKVKEFLNALTVPKDYFVFNDKTLAKEFALLFIKVNNEYYASPYGTAMFCLLADAMKLGLKKGIISKTDLFSTDEFVYGKLADSKDSEIINKLELISKETVVKEDNKVFDYCTVKKQRFVDPGILLEGNVKRLSELDERFNKALKRFKKSRKEYKLRVLKVNTDE